MKRQDIIHIMDKQAYPDLCLNPILRETHISWVIITDQYAFKIKKPVGFGFLDFRDVNKRAYHCRREVLLNSRFSSDMYLRHIPVKQDGDYIYIGDGRGESD